MGGGTRGAGLATPCCSNNAAVSALVRAWRAGGTLQTSRLGHKQVHKQHRTQKACLRTMANISGSSGSRWHGMAARSAARAARSRKSPTKSVTMKRTEGKKSVWV